MKNNRIPRNFNQIKAVNNLETSGGRPGDVFEITRNTYGGNLHGTNTRTGESFYIFISHLRIPEAWTILEIV